MLEKKELLSQLCCVADKTLVIGSVDQLQCFIRVYVQVFRLKMKLTVKEENNKVKILRK